MNTGFMSVTVSHLKAAEKTLAGAHHMAGVHYEKTTAKAATIARKAIRAQMPRAKKSKTHLPPDRKPGALRKAVYIKATGHGWSASRSIHAGGMAHVLIPGARAHEIAPKNAKALHLSGQQGADVVAVVPHPAIPGHPWVEMGRVVAMPLIETLIAETGKRIVFEMAAEIER